MGKPLNVSETYNFPKYMSKEFVKTFFPATMSGDQVTLGPQE